MSTPTVGPESLITLHLRIMHEGSGTVMYSSFEATPMTLKLGAGELIPALEKRILGMPAGTHETLRFAPGEAFGPYKEDLVEHVARRDIPAELELAPDTVFSFPAPDGSSYPGLVRELTEAHAVIDFNHPLAGKAVAVEFEIIGIL